MDNMTAEAKMNGKKPLASGTAGWVPAVPRSQRIAAALQPKLRTMLTKNRRLTQLQLRKKRFSIAADLPAARRGDSSDYVEEPLS
jgi:hypothetical protein